MSNIGELYAGVNINIISCTVRTNLPKILDLLIFYIYSLTFSLEIFIKNFFCKNSAKYCEWTISLDDELCTLLQGISHCNVSFKMALTDRNMQVTFCLKVSVNSWGLEIWVSSISFQKIDIGWPQQPQRKGTIHE